MVKTMDSPVAAPTRDRLVETARQLFLTKGYEATGIAEILRKAEVNSGSLYYLFKTKEALLLAVLSIFYNFLTTDREIIDNIPVLVELQKEASGLDDEQLMALIETVLIEAVFVEAVLVEEGGGEEESSQMNFSDEDDEFEFLLEEELEGTRL